MQPESIWCGDCNGPHRVCQLCGQLVSYDALSKLTMDAHRSSHHWCRESPEYAMRSRAIAERYARQERQMISDCPRCPSAVVFRYAGEPMLYEDVQGEIVHNCDKPETPVSPVPPQPSSDEPQRPSSARLRLL